MFKKKYLWILASMIVSFSAVPTFAINENKHGITVQTQESTIDAFIEEIYSIYPKAAKVEFISAKNGLHYFRLFEEVGNIDYKLIEYNSSAIDVASKFKEVIWIWAKDYASDVIGINFDELNTDDITAKIHLKNGDILKEKIVFTDPINNQHFVYPNASEQTISSNTTNYSTILEGLVISLLNRLS